MKRITVATEKPFAAEAITEIKAIAEAANYQLQLLEKYKSVADLKEAAAQSDALIVRSDKITKEIIEAGEALKVVVRAGAGYDNVDLEAAKEKGIVVMNTPGQNANAVAELVFGMLIFKVRNSFSGDSGTELKGKTLGIHAYGNIGREVSRIAQGMGMKVMAFDPFVEKMTMEKDGVTPANSIEELYSNSNIVSLHIPANEATIKSINGELLALMPKNAVLVNTARKEVIDEESLLNFMKTRPDFKYLSDIAPSTRAVFEAELSEQVFFTPKKMGAQTAEANLNAGKAAAQQIVNYLEHGDETFRVNP